MKLDAILKIAEEFDIPIIVLQKTKLNESSCLNFDR